MATKAQEKKWSLFQLKHKALMVSGLATGKIFPYNEDLIEKLRNIYNGGIPASIILLSNGMSNGYCYDRALLMARAFIDEEDLNVEMIYADVDSIKLNPNYIDTTAQENEHYADHCFLQITEESGDQFICDTSTGFIYEKSVYWKIENPNVRKVNDKEAIKRFIKLEDELEPEDVERDKYIAPLILPIIEQSYGAPTEMYAQLGIDLLQREIEMYKEKIQYQDLCEEIEQDMQRVGLVKK